VPKRRGSCGRGDVRHKNRRENEKSGQRKPGLETNCQFVCAVGEGNPAGKKKNAERISRKVGGRLMSVGIKKREKKATCTKKENVSTTPLVDEGPLSN